MSMEYFRYKIELPENAPAYPYEDCYREFSDKKKLYRTAIDWDIDGMTLDEVTIFIAENYPDPINEDLQ